MNNFEGKIRDYLASHLECLNEDLSLLQKEYPLPNLFGAAGFIDILARDPFGHYVLIEIKRSNQSARAALHELTKYVALLKASLGLPPKRIRAILLSTEWHELGVPFSEYLALCEVETSGYMIEVQSDGTVVSAFPFIPIERNSPLAISRAQDLILFASKSARDNALKIVKDAASHSSLEDFCLFYIDYSGSNPRVIHPYGIYLVFSSPLLGKNVADQKAIKKSIGWDSNLDLPDENFLCAFHLCLGTVGDEKEIGYPEKLRGISQEWHIAVASRQGRYAANQLLIKDSDIITEAMRVEGGASLYLTRVVSPRFSAIWKQLTKDVQLVLLGNKIWEEMVKTIMRDIVRKHSNSTVSFHIYNPADCLLGLAKLARYNDLSFLPSFEIMVSSDSICLAYLGFLACEDKPVNITVREWIEAVYESLDKYLTFRHFGEQFIFDDKARELIGVKSPVLEIDLSPNKHRSICSLSKNKGRLLRNPLAPEGFKPLREFFAKNPRFSSDLITEVAAISLGIVNL